MRQVKLIRNKELAAVTFDLEDEVFIVYIASISLASEVHTSQRA